MALLDRVLREEMGEHCSDRELKRAAATEYVETARVFNSIEQRTRHFESILQILRSFVGTQKQLPSNVVYDVHTTVGLLCQKMNNPFESTGAFLRALWVVNTPSFPKEELAMTLHRMAISKVELKRYEEASHLLHRAVTTYEKLSLRKDDPRLKDATGLYIKTKEKATQSSQRARNLRDGVGSRKRLACVAESREEDSSSSSLPLAEMSSE